MTKTLHIAKKKKDNSTLSEREVAFAAQNQIIKDSLSLVKHKFIVMSGKGGVGKTSVAANLAIALSKKGARVGLMDVDLHGPDIPGILGLKGVLEASVNGQITPKPYSENLEVVSVGSMAGDPDKAIIVTMPQKMSLNDVRRSINFCKDVKMEVFGLIENMSGFVCPNCGTSIDLFGSGGGFRTAAAMNIPFLGQIPVDSRMVKCADAGESYMEKYQDSEVTKEFNQVVAKILNQG